LREVEAPTFSDIRLIDGGKVVSPTRWPLLPPSVYINRNLLPLCRMTLLSNVRDKHSVFFLIRAIFILI
jgi:hypothetical protein